MSEFYDSAASQEQALENKLVNTALTKYPVPFLSGMKLNADIEINGLTLNTIDENETIWVVNDIEGWWTLPEPEIPDVPRGWGDGSYDAIGRWTNRIMTLNGSFLTQTPEDAATARATLMGVISPLVRSSTAGYLIVDEPDLSNPGQVIRKSAKVRLSDTPEIISVNARGRHDFSIGLKAVDPVKYEFISGDPDGYDSRTLTANALGIASTSITNSGDIAVPIIIELSANFQVSNPVIGFCPRIQIGSDWIDIVDGTGENIKLEIDTYNREALKVTYDGEEIDLVENGRSNLAVIVTWLYLEPGSNTVSLARFPENSTCTIYYKSGWIG